MAAVLLALLNLARTKIGLFQLRRCRPDLRQAKLQIYLAIA